MDKLITAVEPFALSMILLAGASMAHWISFTNSYVVGLATVFCGIMLMLKHVYLQIKKDSSDSGRFSRALGSRTK